MIITLVTGREIDANRSILGMTWTGELVLTEGYDGEPDYDPPLSLAERRDIARHMKNRWDDWANLTAGRRWIKHGG